MKSYGALNQNKSTFNSLQNKSGRPGSYSFTPLSHSPMDSKNSNISDKLNSQKQGQSKKGHRILTKNDNENFNYAFCKYILLYNFI